MGVLLSGHRTGACLALVWQADAAHYRCGAITAPASVVANRLPRALQGGVPALAWLLRRWARRWVAAGIGCDCAVQVERPLPAPGGFSPPS